MTAIAEYPSAVQFSEANLGRPLHVVTLLGSLRQGSFNGAVARALPDLAPHAMTISQLGSVADFPHYDSDLQDQGIPSAVSSMSSAIMAADAVIVVSPEYNYSIPGALKNAFDWLSRFTPQPFSGKPIAIQTASPGILGGARAQYQLRQMFVALNARVLNGPEVMIGQAAAKMNNAECPALVDEKTRAFIAGQLVAFAAFVRACHLSSGP